MTAAQALRALGGAPESVRTLTNAELYAKVDGRLLLSIQNVAERMLAQGLSQAEVLSRLADACFMSVQGLARVLKRGRGEAQPTQEEGEKRPRGRPWSLSEEDYQAAAEAARKDPRKHFDAAWGALQQRGVEVTRRTLRGYLKRRGFKKRPGVDYSALNEQLMEIHVAHLASLRQFAGKKNSPGFRARLRRLFWQDESYYKMGVGRRQCLSDKPVNRDQLPRPGAEKGRGKDGKSVHVQKVNMRYDSFGCRVRGPTTWAEFKVMAAEVVQEMNATKGLFRSFIHRRGLGGEFDKRWSETAAYKAALPRVQPYDVMALAFRPQLVEHSAEPPKSRALCASYCGWWLAHVALGASMVPSTPPPGPAGPCGGDGYENTCRTCGTGETKAHPAGTLLLCDADGCTAAWHTKCLGIKSVPPGRWECPCCVHTPGKACMPQWPAVAPRKGSKAAKLAQAPQLNLLVEEGDDGEESDAN
jgi:transposase